METYVEELIKNSLFFDADWYRKEYKISETVDCVKHYLLVGYKWGYDPSPFFSTREYFNENLDVAIADVNPLLHYEQYGIKEGRYKKIRGIRKEIAMKNPSCTNRMEDGLLRIRITNACNGKCRYCGLLAWSEEERSTFMDPKWYYEYCKPLYEKIKLLLITGGDAYVAKESYNYMKFMSENYPHITIITESNGIGFSERFRELASDNLFKVHISLNASNSEIYQKGCWEGPGGESAYNKVMENLTEYQALLKSKNMECFAPDISMVINKDTANDVVDFVKLALRLKLANVGFYFDYTESNMYGDYFGCPETSRPALRALIEMERVLARKFFISFRLWIPSKELLPIQNEVNAVDINKLREKYKELLELAEGRDMQREFELRNKIREEKGKKPLSFDEEWNPTIRLTTIDNRKICFAPWQEIDLYPTGRMDFCSWFVETLNIKDYIKDNYVDWDEILDSPEFMIIRNRMLNGNYSGCLACCPMNSCKTEAQSLHKYGFEREEEYIGD